MWLLDNPLNNFNPFRQVSSVANIVLGSSNLCWNWNLKSLQTNTGHFYLRKRVCEKEGERGGDEEDTRVCVREREEMKKTQVFKILIYCWLFWLDAFIEPGAEVYFTPCLGMSMISSWAMAWNDSEIGGGGIDGGFLSTGSEEEHIG